MALTAFLGAARAMADDGAAAVEDGATAVDDEVAAVDDEVAAVDDDEAVVAEVADGAVGAVFFAALDEALALLVVAAVDGVGTAPRFFVVEPEATLVFLAAFATAEEEVDVEAVAEDFVAFLG